VHGVSLFVSKSSIKTIAHFGSESISNVENKGDKVKFNKTALLSTLTSNFVS